MTEASSPGTYRELMQTIWRGLRLMARDPALGEASKRGLLLMISVLERRYGFKQVSREVPRTVHSRHQDLRSDDE